MESHAPEIVEEPAGERHKNHRLHLSLFLSFYRFPILAASGLHLGGSALGTLLADLSATLGGGGGELGLLSLLGGGSSLLLLLALLDGLGSGGGASLGADVALLLDHIEGSTDDASLGLDSSAGSLLGNLLYKKCQSCSGFIKTKHTGCQSMNLDGFVLFKSDGPG